MSDSERKFDRREFLTKGAAVAAGLGCWRLGLREVLAQSRVAGKPLLTAASLNASIPKAPAQFRTAAQQARANLKGYIRDHFTLTPAQDKALTAMPPVDVNKLVSAINTALQKNYRLQVHTSPRNPSPGNTTGQNTALSGQHVKDPITLKRGLTAEQKESGLQIGPVSLTADGSYSHHDGFSGTVSVSWSC